MKKLLLALTLTASLSAQADYSSCVAVAQLAQATMSARQAGVPYEALAEVTNTPRTLVILDDAFSRYQFLTEDFRRQSTQDFAMEYYAMCLDGYI